jgi:NitT/TauT family transport system substrate-binding protein
MHRRHADGWSRREFLELTLAGTAGLLGLQPESLAAEQPPETTRLRLIQAPSICQAPQYVAEEFLQGEGFAEVQYVKQEGTAGTVWMEKALASGEADIGMHYAAPIIIRLDLGDPIVVLAGGHIGCIELFGTERVQALRDLKGKTVAVFELGSAVHVFLASMLAYVGLNPNTDINWDTSPPAEVGQLLAQGKIDALITAPPGPQILREKGIGHVVVNTAVDRPWSQYFCCMVIANKEFVQKHPVATKRALRAILKATNLCALQPDQAAHLLVDKGFTPRHDHALQALKDIPYQQWQEYSPEDTMRFYALRLHEIGMIKSSPQKIIAEGTDWRFLNEIKKEMADGR